MKVIIKWILIRVIFCGFLYLGFVEGIEGAKNVALSMCWLWIALTTAVVLKQDAEDFIRRVPKGVSIVFYVMAAGFLVWNSAIFTGVLWLIVSLVWEVNLKQKKS